MPEVQVNGQSEKLPPIDTHANGVSNGVVNGMANGACQAVKDVDSMKTPGGGIKAKKTKQKPF